MQGGGGGLFHVEALHFAYGKFAFEFEGDFVGSGRNPGLHIIGCLFAPFTGETE